MIRTLTLLLVAASLLKAQDPVALASEVKAIFVQQCAKCHDGGPGRRSRGEFSTVLDLEDVVSRYVTPGDLDD